MTDVAQLAPVAPPARPAIAAVPPMPWRASLLLAAGTFVFGAAPPLYDSYVPQLLERHFRSSTLVGAAMGIDNVLALLLVPMIGAMSDATRSRLGRRMPWVLGALPFAAIGMVLLPAADTAGSLALLATIIVLNVGLAVWRAPFTALLSELVPSVHRPRTAGMQGVSMCLAAMLVLSTARSLSARDPSLPFLLAGGLLGAVWLTHAIWLREPVHEDAGVRPAIAPLRSLRETFAAGGGLAPRFFAACLCFHMAFQSFSSWFTLHASERFHTTVGDASLGFIAVAIATLLGSMPAGWLGARYGRRRMAIIGMTGMAVACILLQLAPTLPVAVAFCFVFGFSWSFPVANLIPMGLELGSAARAGSLAGALLLVQSLAGVVGPAIVGSTFDALHSKRPLFLLLAAFLVGAIALLATLRSGFGEAT
jgi:Na+/melibiose symporter-like transporter